MSHLVAFYGVMRSGVALLLVRARGPMHTIFSAPSTSILAAFFLDGLPTLVAVRNIHFTALFGGALLPAVQLCRHAQACVCACVHELVCWQFSVACVLVLLLGGLQIYVTRGKWLLWWGKERRELNRKSGGTCDAALKLLFAAPATVYTHSMALSSSFCS